MSLPPPRHPQPFDFLCPSRGCCGSSSPELSKQARDRQCWLPAWHLVGTIMNVSPALTLRGNYTALGSCLPVSASQHIALIERAGLIILINTKHI